MAQELYLLRDIEDEIGVNILTEPNTPITDFTVSISHMGDNKLSAKFHYPTRIEFDFTEYVVYKKEGEYDEEDAYETYYLISPPSWEKNEKSLMIEYNCEFVSKLEILKYVPMIDSWEAISSDDTAKKPTLFQTEYSFFGSAYDYFTNIKSSMCAEFGTRYEGVVPQPIGWGLSINLDDGYPQVGDDTSITVSNTNVFDALKDLYEKFKVPFFISNTAITVGGIKQYVTNPLRYGKGNGLYKINKSASESDIITKIRGVGSEKNIPFNYLQSNKADAGLADVPMSRLMPFVFRDTLSQAAEEVIPLSAVKDYYTSENYNQAFPRLSFETFDDIYPTIKGSLYNDNRIDIINGVYFEATSVSAENETTVIDDAEEIKNPRFWVKIPPLGFDLKSHLNEKDKLVLIPVNGQCGGCKFDVLSIGSRPNIWSAYKTQNFYADSVLDYDGIDDEVFNKGVKASVVESNKRVLYPNTKITYNFIGDWAVNWGNSFKIDHSYTEYKISLYKDDTEILVILDEYASVRPSDYPIYTKTGNISVSGDYIVPEGETGEYYVKIETYTSVAGNYSKTDKLYGYSKLHIKADACILDYPELPEEVNDTSTKSLWLYCQKDINTYGTLMPYVIEPKWTSYTSPTDWENGVTGVGHINPDGIVPVIGDEYELVGITLPESYIINAELRLENTLKEILNDKKDFKYTYDCGFDEKMLIENPNINTEMQVGSIVKIYDITDPSQSVDGEQYTEVVINEISLKYSADKVLPIQSN